MSLTGRTIVLTRDPAGNRAWARSLASTGAGIYNLPTISTEPVELTPELTQSLTNTGQFDWIIFTSAAGVRHAHQLLERLKVNMDTPANPPAIAVIGERTAAAIRAAGFIVAFVPTRASAAALAAELPSPAGRRILLLRTVIAGPTLAQALTRRGALVTDLPIYQTKLRTDPDPTFAKFLRTGRIHYLTFASPSAVQGFTCRLSQNPAELTTARSLPALAIGPTTGTALHEAKFTAVHQALRPTIQAIRATLLDLAR